IPVRADGTLDEATLEDALARPVDLLSLMWVNNEVGLVLPVADVAERARAAGVLVHTDMVQAVGKVPIDLSRTAVALASVTGHKIYGPKSAGALFVRRGTVLDPCLFGGGQERALRPGTQDVAGAVGLATAVELAVAEQQAEATRLGALRAHLLGRLRERIPDLIEHGDARVCAPHVLNVGIPGVDAMSLVLALDLEGVAVSAGSACASGGHRGSHVLEALYPGRTGTVAAVRFSLGRLVDTHAVDRAAEVTATVVERLREGAPAPRNAAPTGRGTP
ncbi:MAG: aminotransferase class V-fold PLP-dependent enzyme, partial [Gemmatimonadetes bacterium]